MPSSSQVGPDVFPVVVGQFLEDSPMTLVYVEAVTVLVAVAIFVLTAVLAKKL